MNKQESDEPDPISHWSPLEQAPDGSKLFHDNQNEAPKDGLKPALPTAAQ